MVTLEGMDASEKSPDLGKRMPTKKQNQPALGMDSLFCWVPFLTRNFVEVSCAKRRGRRGEATEGP